MDVDEGFRSKLRSISPLDSYACTLKNEVTEEKIRNYNDRQIMYMGHYQKMEESVSLLIFSHPGPPLCCFPVNNT